MKTTFNIPQDWLVDPVSKSLPRFEGNLARCLSGDYIFDQQHHYWDFTPQNLDSLLGAQGKVWEQLQANGVASYINDPASNLGVGERADHLAFGDFCNLDGAVLDVGCGPQLLPTHFRPHLSSRVVLVGIDPLTGDQPRDFTFVKGLGEYLPFKDELFDRLLFVTSLDHFLDFKPPLLEAKRVLRADGTICVWIGEKNKLAPAKESPDWYRKLKVPEGAEDAFHYRRFTAADFETYLREMGLTICEQIVHPVDPWRKNLFFRITKQ